MDTLTQNVDVLETTDYKYKWCGGAQRCESPKYLHDTEIIAQDREHQLLVCKRCARRERFALNERSERYRLFTYRDILQSWLEPALFRKEYGEPKKPYK